MKKSLLILFALISNFCFAQNKISSPDSKLEVELKDQNGILSYTIKYDGEVFVEESRLGLKMNFADFSDSLKISKQTLGQINQNYSLKTIKKNQVNYIANTSTFTISRNNRNVFEVIFNVSNNDVAFCYNILEYKNGDYFCAATIDKECTEFNLTQNTTTFLCPQMSPMTGFAATAPSYETHYKADQKPDNNGWGDGFTFPCLFKNGEKGWLQISETSTNGNYVGCHLSNTGFAKYQIAFPNPKELNSFSSNNVAVSLPAKTPWRTITLGNSLKAIVESTITWDVVEPQYTSDYDFTYGCGTWSWIIKMDSSCNYDEQKNYIDFAAKMGYKSVLIDALWDTQIGRERMEELVKYAKTKDVGIFLWYNSNGTWNHAPQGPKGILNRLVSRKAEMQWLNKIGVRGMKIDFFGGDKQAMMQYYEDLLSDANDNNLMLIFHGCTLPRGWERMYPNFVAAEAVRASENLHFSQYECDIESFNASMYAFSRNAVGSMDFGGSTLNKYYNADNNKGSMRKTSDVYALATAILFQSPCQHFALAPNNLEDAPSWAIEFMKNVPTLWQDIKFIDGYPGKYAIFARKTADKWIITGINADQNTIVKKLNLSEFNFDNSVTVYKDDKNLNGSKSEVKLPKNKTIEISIPKNGGLVIQ